MTTKSITYQQRSLHTGGRRTSKDAQHRTAKLPEELEQMNAIPGYVQHGMRIKDATQVWRPRIPGFGEDKRTVHAFLVCAVNP